MWIPVQNWKLYAACLAGCTAAGQEGEEVDEEAVKDVLPRSEPAAIEARGYGVASCLSTCNFWIGLKNWQLYGVCLAGCTAAGQEGEVVDEEAVKDVLPRDLEARGYEVVRADNLLSWNFC